MEATKKALLVGDCRSIHFWRWCGFCKLLGYEVDILTFTREKNKALDYSMFGQFFDRAVQVDGNKLIILLKKAVNFFKAVLLVRKKYSFVNYHYIGTLFASLAFFTRSTYMLTCWGSDIIEDYPIAKRFSRHILDRCYIKASYITMDAASVQEMLIKMQPKVDRNKTQVITWGVSLDRFSPADDTQIKQLRNKYRIPEKSLVLLSIRNVDPFYNIQQIIEWFVAKIHADNIVLLIRVSPYSIPSEVEKCKALANKHPRIIFNSDPIDYFNIAEIYRVSDIDLHYPHSDAVPVSILEGVACGNVIVGDEGIDAYKELAKIYRMHTIKLDALTEEFLIELGIKKKEYLKINTEVFKNYHDEKISVEKLRTVLQTVDKQNK